MMSKELVGFINENRTFYKFLDEDMTGGYSDFRYTPGEWTPDVWPLEMCRRGYHVFTAEHALKWLQTGSLWRVDVKGRGLAEDEEKRAFRSIRLVERMNWDENIAQLWAADCIAHALPIFERECPGDDRVRKAIITRRAFARGEIDAATRNAAWDAARNAASAAALSPVGDALWDEIGAAAGAVVSAAQRAATKDAAGAVVSAAAWAAASAVTRDAELARAQGAAARASAWNAARDVTRDAEIKWQIDQLWAYAKGIAVEVAV